MLTDRLPSVLSLTSIQVRLCVQYNSTFTILHLLYCRTTSLNTFASTQYYKQLSLINTACQIHTLTGNDDRYVSNVLDVRYSVFESLIRSIEHGRLELHRKFPKTESLKVKNTDRGNLKTFSNRCSLLC
jgi:hypothetical protein